MQIAVISDIHGNLTALEAVLKDLENIKYDQLICLGDTSTLGPQPIEVIEKLRSLDCIFISGNHEFALTNIDSWDEMHIAPQVRENVSWCLTQLKNEHIAFFDTFLNKYSFNAGKNLSILFCHSAPESVTNPMHPKMDAKILTNLCQNFSENVFVNGHLHWQFCEKVNGKLYVNPGSVGMPFLLPPEKGQSPKMSLWAEYAIINIDYPLDKESPNLQVDMHKVKYDFSVLKKALIESTMPKLDWWLEQMPS